MYFNPDSATMNRKTISVRWNIAKIRPHGQGETVETLVVEDLFDHSFDLAGSWNNEDTNQNNSRPIDSSEAGPSGSERKPPESTKEAEPSGSGK